MDRESVMFLLDVGLRGVIAVAFYFAFKLASKHSAFWIVNIFVFAAEQMFSGAGLGPEKKEWVLNKISIWLKLSREELEILIEAAVSMMNKEYEKYFLVNEEDQEQD